MEGSEKRKGRVISIEKILLSKALSKNQKKRLLDKAEVTVRVRIQICDKKNSNKSHIVNQKNKPT
jgi:hypothetical protein